MYSIKTCGVLSHAQQKKIEGIVEIIWRLGRGAFTFCFIIIHMKFVKLQHLDLNQGRMLLYSLEYVGRQYQRSFFLKRLKVSGVMSK